MDTGIDRRYGKWFNPPLNLAEIVEVSNINLTIPYYNIRQHRHSELIEQIFKLILFTQFNIICPSEGVKKLYRGHVPYQGVGGNWHPSP